MGLDTNHRKCAGCQGRRQMRKTKTELKIDSKLKEKARLEKKWDKSQTKDMHEESRTGSNGVKSRRNERRVTGE